MASLSREQAVERAVGFGRQQGLAVEGYDVRAEPLGAEWYVHFTPRAGTKPAPGDFFTIIVDDRGNAPPRLAPGK